MNDVLAEVLALLEAALTTRCKKYYQGEVVVPPRSALPCLMVIGNQTSLGRVSTASDEWIYSITIKVVADVMSFVKDTGMLNDIVLAQKTLIDIIEERESNTQLKTNTVLGTLRKNANIRGAKFVYNNNFSVQYDAIRTGQMFYATASVTCDVVSDLTQRS